MTQFPKNQLLTHSRTHPFIGERSYLWRLIQGTAYSVYPAVFRDGLGLLIGTEAIMFVDVHATPRSRFFSPRLLPTAIAPCYLPNFLLVKVSLSCIYNMLILTDWESKKFLTINTIKTFSLQYASFWYFISLFNFLKINGQLPTGISLYRWHTGWWVWWRSQ